MKKWFSRISILALLVGIGLYSKEKYCAEYPTEKLCAVPSPTPTPTPVPTVEPTPVPTPTSTPIISPTPPPTPSPTPTPVVGVQCPAKVVAAYAAAPNRALYINAKRYNSGVDSTYRVRSSSFDLCAAIGHDNPSKDCHFEDPSLTVDERGACEILFGGGCPVWNWKSGSDGGHCSNDTSGTTVSCDHFGDPTFRDDPKTPQFEGRPKACGNQTDKFGYNAGFFAQPQCTPGQECSVQACLPDRSVCSGWVRVFWRE